MKSKHKKITFERVLSMKISDINFFRASPIFYQPFLYGKSLKSIKKTSPLSLCKEGCGSNCDNTYLKKNMFFYTSCFSLLMSLFPFDEPNRCQILIEQISHDFRFESFNWLLRWGQLLKAKYQAFRVPHCLILGRWFYFCYFFYLKTFSKSC